LYLKSKTIFTTGWSSLQYIFSIWDNRVCRPEPPHYGFFLKNILIPNVAEKKYSDFGGGKKK
jgi:hypothetical protein